VRSRSRSRPWGPTRLSTDPGPAIPTPGTSQDDPGSGPRRPTIEERRERREQLDAEGRDRYDSLIRHLQAGRELPLRQRRRSFDIGSEINRVGPKVLAVALVVAAIWLGAIFVIERLQADRIETWAGPDATVQSGQNLAGCELPDVDTSFPAWIRIGDRVYVGSGRSAPLGSESIPRDYAPTGHTLGDLSLFHIENTPAGLARETVMIRKGESAAGAVYEIDEACG
jgi:hypothetical protein